MIVLKWLDDHIEEFLLILLLVLMTLIMGIQVVMRYVFNNSLSWSEEITRYFFIWSAFLSISYCIREQISIKIEQFFDLMPKPVQKVIKVVAKVGMLLFFLFILKYSVEVYLKTYTSGQTSSAIGLPMHLVYLSAVVGFFLSTVRLVQSFVRTVKTPPTTIL